MKAGQWKIDDQNLVEVTQGLWGRNRIFLNGKEVASKVPFRRTIIPFTLTDGRQAEFRIIPAGLLPEREIRVQGHLILSEIEQRALCCLKCASPAKPGDKFCEKCGAPLPQAEGQLQMKKVKEARNMILGLAVIFFIFGIAMFFMQRSVAEKSLQNLAHYQNSDFYPQLIQGKQYTVGELRQSLLRAPFSILATNTILAAIMLGLSFFAKKSPLPAIVIAFAIYIAIQVMNAVAAPETIGQGVVMKIIIIMLLIRGLRSALELRKLRV